MKVTAPWLGGTRSPHCWLTLWLAEPLVSTNPIADRSWGWDRHPQPGQGALMGAWMLTRGCTALFSLPPVSEQQGNKALEGQDWDLGTARQLGHRVGVQGLQGRGESSPQGLGCELRSSSSVRLLHLSCWLQGAKREGERPEALAGRG